MEQTSASAVIVEWAALSALSLAAWGNCTVQLGPRVTWWLIACQPACLLECRRYLCLSFLWLSTVSSVHTSQLFSGIQLAEPCWPLASHLIHLHLSLNVDCTSSTGLSRGQLLTNAPFWRPFFRSATELSWFLWFFFLCLFWTLLKLSTIPSGLP